jgi:hypothetical protein
VTRGYIGEEKTTGQLHAYGQMFQNGTTHVPYVPLGKMPLRQRGPLGTIQADYLVQIVAADILGPLPETKDCNVYVLVASPNGRRLTPSLTRRLSQSSRNW